MFVLNISDTHLTGKNPVCRLDDLVALQYNKWDEIVELANEYNTPIIHTGDVFNVPVIANSLLSKLGDTLERLNNPLYFVWGNHDLQYHSIDMWDRTSLGVLWSNNVNVKHISEFYKDYNIKLDYCDWDQPIETTGSNILISHKAVVLEKMLGKNSWIADDESFATIIDHTPALHKYKLIICGHWHLRYTQYYKNTTIINSGPIIRRTVVEREIPGGTFIDLKSSKAETITLKIAKNSDKVMSRRHLDKVTTDQEEKESIISLVQQFKEQQKESDKKHPTSNFVNKLIQLLDSHMLSPKQEEMLRDIMLVALKKNKEEG